MRRTTFLLAMMLFLTTAAMAAPLTETWSPFRNPIDSCALDASCTVNDTVTIAVGETVTVDSGATGYCGTAGARAVVDVPANATVLRLTVDAAKDSWGPGPAILLNGREVRRFSAGDNPDAETWEDATVRVNVSGIGGHANLSVIVSDHSQDWCNMGDHTQRITIQQASFGVDDGGGRATGSTMVETGETVTFTVGSAQHTVEPVAVTDPSTVSFYLDGDLKQREEGGKVALDGAELTVVDVTQYANGNATGTMTFRVNQTEDRAFTLGRLDEQIGEGDAVVVPDAAGPNVTATARRLAKESNAVVVTPQQAGIYDTYDDVVLIGGPAINPLVQELAEQGRTWTQAEWTDRRDTALLQTLERPSSIVIVAGYDRASHLRALTFLAGVLDGEHAEMVAGRQRLVLQRATPDQDLAVEGITARPMDGGFNVTYTVTAQRRTEAMIRYLPSGPSERHILLEGRNRFTRFVDGTRTVSARLGSELRVGGVTVILSREEGGAVALTMGSRRREVRPGGTVRVGNATLLLLNMTRSSTGGSAMFRVETGMRAVGAVVDPADSIDETNETNNRKLILVGNVTQPPRPPREQEPRTVERTIPLEPGWNMISVKEQTPLQELTDDCRLRRYRGERVWRYGGGWHHSTTLQPRLGYYVYSSSACVATYTVKRMPRFQPAQNGSRLTAGQGETDARPGSNPWRLEQGWNMIGVGQETSLAKLRAQCDIRRYQDAAMLTYSDGWQRYAMEAALDPETGYFVNVAAPCTLGVLTNLPDGDSGNDTVPEGGR